MNGHGCRPTCTVCAREAARARDTARAQLLPLLTPYFDQPEEAARDRDSAA